MKLYHRIGLRFWLAVSTMLAFSDKLSVWAFVQAAAHACWLVKRNGMRVTTYEPEPEETGEL